MKKVNIYKWIFYISYIFLCACTILKKVNNLSIILSLLHNTIPFLLMYLIILNTKKIKFKSLIIIFMIAICLTVTYYITDISDMLYTFLFIIAAKDISVDDFIKKDAIIKIIFVLIVIIAYHNSLAENVVMYRQDGTIRNSLGFAHPNHLGLYLFNICCDIFYLNYKKIKLSNYIILITALLVCIFVCDSRAAQISLLIILLIKPITNKIETKRIVKTIVTYLPIFLFVISIICVFLYSKKVGFIMKLDSMLSTRIKCAYNFISYYKVNLFGNYFEDYGKWGSGSKLTVLDNAYIHTLMHYGIIAFAAIIATYQSIIKTAIKKKEYRLFIFIIPFLIYGLMERHIVEIQYNCSLIYICNIIYDQIQRSKKNEENSDDNISLII